MGISFLWTAVQVLCFDSSLLDFLPMKTRQPKLNLREGTYTRAEQRAILSIRVYNTETVKNK